MKATNESFARAVEKIAKGAPFRNFVRRCIDSMPSRLGKMDPGFVS